MYYLAYGWANKPNPKTRTVSDPIKMNPNRSESDVNT